MQSTMDPEDAQGAPVAEGEGATRGDAASAAQRDAEASYAYAGRGPLGRLDELTDEDLEQAGGTRGGLVQVIARRYGISGSEAKRYVRDMLRVVRTVAGGPLSRSKRMRRTFERTGRDIGEVVARSVESVQDLVRVLAAGNLGGEVIKRLQRPRREVPPAEGTPLPGTGAPAAPPEPDRERIEAS